MPEKFLTRPERPSDAAAIDALQQAAFGPGAYARAAFRVREEAAHDPSLSFVTEAEGALVASVRLTPIAIGEARGQLLGPLVVDSAHKNQGFGKALVQLALRHAEAAGCPFVLLVGDAPYYGPLGFRPIPPKQVALPGPVDPARLLVAELKPRATESLAGMVRGETREGCRAAPPLDEAARVQQVARRA
jgi:predicted N-acetyltransferase YhbS